MQKIAEYFWSSSGNILNSFHKRNPTKYLSEAIRVEVEKEAHINLGAYSEHLTDNF